MSNTTEGSISRECYLKILLHSFKWSEHFVGGLLLGSIHGQRVTFEDAIPLFHNPMTSSLCEVGGETVAAYLRKTGSSLHVVGVYAGQAELAAHELSLPVLQFARSVLHNTRRQSQESGSHKEEEEEEEGETLHTTCVLQISASKIGSMNKAWLEFKGESATGSIHTFSLNTIQGADSFLLLNEECKEKITLLDGQVPPIYDLEENLEQPTRDFLRNPEWASHGEDGVLNYGL